MRRSPQQLGDTRHSLAADVEDLIERRSRVDFEARRLLRVCTVVRVADIRSGPGDSNPGRFTVFNNELYFQATDGASGIELWKVTANGSVVRAADISPGGSGSNPGS